MKTKETIDKLRLIANTIEELEITDIVNISIDYTGQINCQVEQLNVNGDDIIWLQRFSGFYQLKKIYYCNNICFYTLCTQEEYDKERLS